METELHLAQQKLRMRLIRTLLPLKNAVLPLLAVGLLLAACSDDPTSPDPDPDPVTVDAAFTITPEEPSLGETVTLDAGNSSVSGSSVIEYSWTLSTPDDSNAELDDPTSSTTTFEADVEGEFEVTLEVSAEGESDSASMLIEVRAVEEIDSNITADKTLFSDVLYLVTNRISVSATLTIEPGTTIEFQEDTGMQIGEEGILIADGTAQDSIRFTAAEQTPGYWDGLWFAGSQSTSNLLNYTIIEYGGGNNFWSTQDLYANLTVGGRTDSYDARLELRNSTLRYSAGVGLKVRLGSSMPNSENNTYTENSDAPVFTQAPLMNYLSSGSDFTGNGNDYVLVSDETVSGDNRTWNAINVPYRMNGNFSIRDIDLTISSGTNFEFTNGSSLDFRGEGVFLADGNEGEFITFTGTEQEAGWWDGVQLRGALNPNNLMSHTIIEYAGGGGFWSTHDEYANLVIGGRISDDNARLQVVNSNFYNSGGYGLKIAGDGSRMDDSSGNTYTDNTSGAVYLSANTMHYLDSASDFTGNNEGHDFVRVTNTTVTGSQKTWQALNVPYRMSGETRTSDVDITIEPGAEFQFMSGAGLEFRNDSVIEAIGEEDNNILFTGTEQVKGWWKGIMIRTLQPANVMEHVTIEYGGNDSGFWSTQSHYANLIVGHRTTDDAGRLNITNSTLQDSDGYGVYVRAASDVNDDICTANSYSGNEEGECLLD